MNNLNNQLPAHNKVYKISTNKFAILPLLTLK